MVSTQLTGARRSAAALALDPIPAHKGQMTHIQFAKLDKHNSPQAVRPEFLNSILTLRTSIPATFVIPRLRRTIHSLDSDVTQVFRDRKEIIDRDGPRQISKP